MPNPIKYTTGSESDALVKGNFRIGTGSVGKGPSDTTGYYQGPNVPSGGYVIYMNKDGAPGNLSYHSAANDAQLISFTNSLAGQSYTGVQQCFDYYYGQTDKLLVNQDYPADYPYIVMDGLVLNLDAGITQSYPGSGTVWTDVNGLGPKNNGTLTNGPTFSSDGGGSIVFDGVDDYVQTLNDVNITGSSPRTLCSWAKPTEVLDGQFYSISRIGTASETKLFEILLFRSSTTYKVFGHFWGFGQAIAFDAPETVLNVYSYYTLMYDSTTVYIYLNGNLLGQSSNFNLNTGSGKLVLGFPAFSGHFDFKGNISNPQIYNRALTATEVLQNYNAQKGRFGL